MPYTTYKDLEHAAGGPARFLELTDWDGDRSPDADVIAKGQADADGFIDAHLRKFSPTDLARLRTTPTDTIKGIAAAETIYQIRTKRHGVSQEDLTERKQRIETLKEMRSDHQRPDDQKAARSMFIENDSDMSRDKLKGQW